jgi:outer membrane receptor for ferrienterochelin and colicins
MVKRLLYVFLCTQVATAALGQYNVSFHISNSKTGELLSSVSISRAHERSVATNDSGYASIRVNGGQNEFSFSSVGYEMKKLLLVVNSDTVVNIELTAEAHEMEEVVVSSTRTDSRIENTPTRVEVLGAEEVEEETGIKPANVASLLGDVAGIQAQQTSAVTGNTGLRIQGLPADYTQLLRDGMPLFGGYSGGFSVLQIPPLDLKQIEIIKGASSTLYGGGAIAGMINLISKKPKLGEQERYLLLNQSTLRETNINIFLSERDRKRGYTFMAGGGYQRAMDVNKDGFSDLPLTETVLLHPNFFVYPNEKTTISIGLNSTFEERKGGDMAATRNFRDNDPQFFILNRSYRNTLDGSFEHQFHNSDKIVVKGIGSWYYRDITTNSFGLKAQQISWFTEAAYVSHKPKHDIVAGLNITGEDFRKHEPDSSFLFDYKYSTIGLFIQDDWRIHPKLIIETGLRTDFHNEFGTFMLPRISILYKANPYVSSRLGVGFGYKVPTLFNNEIDERDYRFVKFASNSELKAEKSLGANWDVNYKKTLGEVILALNQSFFYTRINNPLVADTSGGTTVFRTAAKAITTKGFETWVQVSYKAWEVYLGFTLVDAKRLYDPIHPQIELSARNKFASVVSYEISSHFRAGMEAAFTGPQYLSDGTVTPAYPFVAAMLRYDIRHFTFVLNCENLLDYRQTKKENIVFPPFSNPGFRQLWAPIDGRVVNLSVRLRF